MISNFSFDFSSLSIFRICLGLVLFYDTLQRWQYEKIHYSNDGILPLNHATRLFWNPDWLCVHTDDSRLFYLFFTQLFAAGLLVVGFCTKLATVACWFLLASLQSRNNLIGFAGDIYLLQLLMLAIFLPTNRQYSIDSWLRGNSNNNHNNTARVCSVATFGLVLQIAMVYVFSAFHKHGASWQTTHDAVWLALHQTYLTTSVGVWLRSHLTQFQLALLTRAVLAWELYAPALLFAPVFNVALRRLFVLTCIALHVGLMITFELGIFGPVCIVAVLPLWPQTRTKQASTATSKQSWLKTIGNVLWQSAVALILYTSFFNNVKEVPHLGRMVYQWHQPVPFVNRLMGKLHLHQEWSMFSPDPPLFNSIHAIETNIVNPKTQQKQSFELFESDQTATPSSLSFNATRSYVQRRVANHRWLKYFERMYWDRHSPSIAPLYLKFVCSLTTFRFNSHHQLDVSNQLIDLYYIESDAISGALRQRTPLFLNYQCGLDIEENIRRWRK